MLMAPHRHANLDAPSARSPVVRWWNAAVLGLLGAGYLVLGWQRRWISDDGLIVIRTVRQALAGNGHNYNAGERVEANTSMLWTYLLVIAGGVTGRDTTRMAVLLGLLLAVAGLVFAADGARRLVRAADAPVPVLPLGALVVLALPPFWDFATSGLETGLVFGWLGLTFWALVLTARSTSRRSGLLLAVLFGLGPLVRPELAVVGVVYLLALWNLRGRGLRPAVLLAVAAGVLPLGYEIFRMGYYGMLVPQTAVSKEASTSLWGRGLTYAGDFSSPYALWLPLLAALVALAVFLVPLVRPVRSTEQEPDQPDRLTQERRIVAHLVVPPVLCGLLLGGYVVKIGGDFMHARMLLPPLFLLMLPVMVVQARVVPAVLAAGTAVWALVCGTSLRPDYQILDVEHGIADERAFWVMAVKDPHPVTARPYLENFLSPSFFSQGRAPGEAAGVAWTDPQGALAAPMPVRDGLPWRFVVVVTNMGVGGAIVGLDEAAIDPIGLSYPLAAHAEQGARLRPGHEKRLPDAFLLADLVQPGAALPPTGPSAADVELARRALDCGAIAELQEAVRAPMTAGRFWDNLVGAPHRTSFRIPLDPAQAVAQFC
jgi:arabinofuranosyltransferase